MTRNPMIDPLPGDVLESGSLELEYGPAAQFRVREVGCGFVRYDVELFLSSVEKWREDWKWANNPRIVQRAEDSSPEAAECNDCPR